MIIALILCIVKLVAQPQNGETIDKIIAVVGNEIIMLSDLEGQLMLYSMQDPSINPNDPETRQKLLDMMINEKLVITKAIEDSIEITDDEIEQGWQYQLANLIQRYGDEKRIEDIYGMSVARIKSEFRDDIRKQLLAQKLRAKEFGETTVTQREVELFFNEYKDSIPDIPEEIELYHIVKNVESSNNQRDEILLLARHVRDSIVGGGDFADFARRYSSDYASAASGGELGWFEKGKLYKEFEDAAFNLLEGQISQPVETPFGLHLIQTLRKNKDSVFTRHILFRIGLSEEDRTKARNALLELRAEALKNNNFEELARKFSDERETQGFGGFLGKFSREYLPGSLAELIDSMKVGDITEPILYGSEPKMSYHIIFKKRVIPKHRPNMEDDYNDISQLATNYKQNKKYLEWIEGLRKTIYWEIVK